MAEPSTSVTQLGNTSEGDIVAGNKNTLQIGAISPTGALTRLLEKLIEEQKADLRAQKIIDELKRFEEPQDTVPTGLEQKLTNGKRTDVLQFAMFAKQEFVKKLAQETLFESAQEIHALVLSKIYSVFSTQISPGIKRGLDRDSIDALIRAQIIDPVVAELQATPFRYYDHHVHGMIYYLTGNCYLRWD